MDDDDVAEDDVGDDDVEDDRNLMMLRRMMLRRRRKMMMMMLRIMMWRRTLCASLRSRNTYACYADICGQNAAPQDATHTLRSRNAHGHATKAVYAEIDWKNAAPHDRDTHCVRACAVEMHMDVTKAIIYRKKGGAPCP